MLLLGLFIISILILSESNEPLLDQQSEETLYSEGEHGNMYIENEWLIMVESEEEAMQIAFQNGLILESVTEFGLAKYYGTENYSSILFNGEIVRMHRNLIYEATDVTYNDPDISEQYALEHVHAEEAWQYSTGSGVLVAVIDTGIDIEHDEFQGKISSLSYNSRTDEVGLEFVDDDYGHGTMVSGVILAKQNNNIGISGVAPDANLLTIKANESGEGLFSNDSLINAIYYAVDNGADVINMSLAGEGYDEIMNTAMEYAASNGVIVVCAAGNDGLPLKLYPAGYDSTISVAATDENMERAAFSNFDRSVDITAPGNNIYTTSLNNLYDTVSGTSLSSPYVAGNIALLMSYYPDASIDDIKDRLYSTAIDLGRVGKDSAFGHGMINAYDSLTKVIRTVSFETFLGTQIDSIKVVEGNTFYLSERPYLEGYHFVDWYKDELLTEVWDVFSDVVTIDMTLYAKYEEGEVFIPEDYDYIIEENDEVTILSYYGVGGDLVIPSEIYGLPVTEINDFAFGNNNNITSIDVPDTVKTIGYGAFQSMYVLESIHLGTGLVSIENAVFAYCPELTSVIFENNLMTVIPRETFYSDDSLTTVVLPDSIINIEMYAFMSTLDLKGIDLPASLEMICQEAFNFSGLESIVIPEGVTAIHDSAFAHNMSLISVSLPSTLSGLGLKVFINCPSLETFTVHPDNTNFVFDNGILFNNALTELIFYSPSNTSTTYTIPSNIETIRSGAFSSCKLEEIIFNQLITHLPEYVFYNAAYLKQVTLPNNITSAGESAFNGATGLESFTFSNSFEVIPQAMFELTLSLKEITFSSDLRSIESNAFMQSGIEYLELPTTLTHLGPWVFAGCYLLDELVLPDSILEIGSLAFNLVEEVNIPSDVQVIGERALPLANMEEVILPDTATDVGELLMESTNGKIRYVDFGQAEHAIMTFYNGSRIETIILGENTVDAVFWGHSMKMIHLYVPNPLTEITFKNDYGYENYVIHGVPGSTAEQFASDHNMEFVSLVQTEQFNINITIDGPAVVNETINQQMTKYDTLKFSLDVPEGYMVYSVLVNGYIDFNMDRHYYYCVTEDLNISFIIKPIDYILDYEYITIENQLITGFVNMNSEYVNLPSYDAGGLPILGFLNDEIPIAYASEIYGMSDSYYEFPHTPDIIHLGFSEFMTHIPVLNNHYVALESVSIPEGVLTMSGVEETPNLESIILPSTLTEFPHWVDENGYERGVFTYCFDLEYVVILSDQITSIPDYAFYDAMYLKEIVIPSSVTSIGEFAFRNSASLKTVYLGNSETVISENAFMLQEWGYIFKWAPFALPDEFRKLPGLELVVPNSGLVTDYAESFSVPFSYGQKTFATYLDDNDKILWIDQLNLGGDSIPPEAPIKTVGIDGFFLFDSWDQTLTNIQDNIIVRPIYILSEEAYRVRFIGFNDSVIQESYYLLGDTIIAPLTIPVVITPEFTYTFLEWDTTFGVVSANLDVYAIYTSSNTLYTIIFTDATGAIIQEETLTYGETIIAPEPPIKENTNTEHYEFTGWSVEFDTVYMNMIIHPTYQTIFSSINISFYDFDGNLIEKIGVFDGEEVIPPTAPIRDGEHFFGWSEDLTNVTNDLSVFPIYVPGFSVITYVENTIVDNPNIIEIAGGQYFTLFLDENHQLYAVGSNNGGQLTLEEQSSSVPVNITSHFPLAQDEYIIEISAGNTFAAVLTSNGRLFTFGRNENGSLGIETDYENNIDPIDITSRLNLDSDEHIVKIDCGEQHVVLLTDKHRVFTWGANWYGQLGDNTTTNSFIPIDITSQFILDIGDYIEDVIIGGNFTCAISANGNLYLWGENSVGQIGNGTQDHQLTPLNVTSFINLNPDEHIRDVSIGQSFIFVLTTDNRIFAWGENYNKELIIETNNSWSAEPLDITDRFPLESGDYIESISCGFQFSIALTNNHRVISWGNGTNGQAGNNQPYNYTTPTDITDWFDLDPLDLIETLYVGNYHAFAVTQNSTTYGWGFNHAGQVGNGHLRNQYIPTIIYIGYMDRYDVGHVYGEEFTLYLPEDTIDFAFGGWYYDYQLTIPCEEDFEVSGYTILYAKWVVREYVIHFDTGGGSLVDDILQVRGGLIEQPTDPVREGYEFDGWYTDNSYTTEYIFDTMPAEDITVYAKWDAKQTTIHFETNCDVVVDDITQDYQTSVMPPTNPERDGYLFGGWYTDETYTAEYVFTTMPVDDITIYAKWINYYIVSFYNDDGTLITEEQVLQGESAQAPSDPIKEADVYYEYTFSHWDSEFNDVTENLSVYAVYTAVEIVYEYSLHPGVDTVVEDTEWIDEGVVCLNDAIVYEVIGTVDIQTEGIYQITYVLSIGDAEIGRIDRIIHVLAGIDEADVVITLNPGITTIPLNGNYQEAGAVTNIGTIMISGFVDTSEAGIYIVKYTVTVDDVTYEKIRCVIVYDNMDDIINQEAVIVTAVKKEDES